MVSVGGEGENPLPFSLTAPKRGAGGVGVGAVSRLRFPPGPHLRGSRFSTHAFARLLPRNFFEGRFCEVRAPGPWQPTGLFDKKGPANRVVAPIDFLRTVPAAWFELLVASKHQGLGFRF